MILSSVARSFSRWCKSSGKLNEVFFTSVIVYRFTKTVNYYFRTSIRLMLIVCRESSKPTGSSGPSCRDIMRLTGDGIRSTYSFTCPLAIALSSLSSTVFFPVPRVFIILLLGKAPPLGCLAPCS